MAEAVAVAEEAASPARWEARALLPLRFPPSSFFCFFFLSLSLFFVGSGFLYFVDTRGSLIASERARAGRRRRGDASERVATGEGQWRVGW